MSDKKESIWYIFFESGLTKWEIIRQRIVLSIVGSVVLIFIYLYFTEDTIKDKIKYLNQGQKLICTNMQDTKHEIIDNNYTIIDNEYIVSKSNIKWKISLCMKEIAE